MKSKPTMLYATHVISHDLGALEGERRAVALAAITTSAQSTPQTIIGVLDDDVVVDVLDDDEQVV